MDFFADFYKNSLTFADFMLSYAYDEVKFIWGVRTSFTVVFKDVDCFQHGWKVVK